MTAGGLWNAWYAEMNLTAINPTQNTVRKDAPMTQVLLEEKQNQTQSGIVSRTVLFAAKRLSKTAQVKYADTAPMPVSKGHTGQTSPLWLLLGARKSGLAAAMAMKRTPPHKATCAPVGQEVKVTHKAAHTMSPAQPSMRYIRAMYTHTTSSAQPSIRYIWAMYTHRAVVLPETGSKTLKKGEKRRNCGQYIRKRCVLWGIPAKYAERKTLFRGVQPLQFRFLISRYKKTQLTKASCEIVCGDSPPMKDRGFPPEAKAVFNHQYLMKKPAKAGHRKRALGRPFSAASIANV